MNLQDKIKAILKKVVADALAEDPELLKEIVTEVLAEQVQAAQSIPSTEPQS